MLSGSMTTGHRLPDYVRRLVDRIKSQNKDHQDAALLSDDESMEMSDGSILKSRRRVASPSASTELARGGSSKGCEVDQSQASTDVPATPPKHKRRLLVRVPASPFSTMSIASTSDGENDMIFMVDKTARFFIDYDTNQLMAMRGGDAKGTPADVVVHEDGFVIGIWHDVITS